MTGQAWDQGDQEKFRAELQAAIDSFLDEQADRLAPLGDDAARLVAEGRAAVTGGKRFRAAFCYWGFRAAAREGYDDRAVLRAAASLELLHASALVHDDLMDASDTRRGRPATHRGFAALHQEQAWPGDPEQYGAAAAILLGDLLLSWSDELLRRCGMPWDRVGPALDVLDTCRSEVIAGQFLDVSAQARGRATVDEAMTVLRYKSAKYSIERPLHIGAALAGAGPETLARSHVLRSPARRGVPAARRPARRVRRPGDDRQARGRRPGRGQADGAHRAGARVRPGTPRPPGSTPRSAPRSPRTRSPSCAASSTARARTRRSRR